jgi:hypothetical protein
MSIRLSILIEKHSYHSTDFREVSYLSIFENLSRKSKILWDLTRTTGILHADQNSIFIKLNLAQFLLEWKTFQTNVGQKIKTHILCSTNFFPGNLAAYEKMWKNTIVPGRPQMTVWRTHCTWWIPKATSAHSEYVILIVFPWQHWLHESISMFRCTYIACLVYKRYTTGKIVLS